LNKKSQNQPVQSTIAILSVIDRLEIGPVKLEARKLTAPYTVITGDTSDRIDLVYKYEEDVFDPLDPASENIGDMIAVQVAFNYGLFCREIVFKGNFDSSDRRLIRNMTENTSREIYAKKFLEPNEFLSGPAASLDVIRQKTFTQANLIFERTTAKPGAGPWQFWENDENRHAVLSSGGKDSLITHGLLDELKKEVHPIFINESGRHWFTAMNAYRYFSKNIKNTARVWTNADRVFNRMLRHLPFIRKDYNKIRSDEYPIRLWTVAVFLFGAIPLLYKRRIGRLLIGDEFDTSVRTSRDGITHYDGLYDQSRYFDNMMTRYFLSKGWSIMQFSAIRPLSEMLIVKILTTRYPHLQQHQISCHAAHVKDDRVYPCGKCEKCRRIVGMLAAQGLDARHCGYTDEQIEHCLSLITGKGLHQESAAEKQLLYLLQSRGRIHHKKVYRQRPEIMHIRFDADHAPFNYMPADLRKKMYEIFLKHSQGAMKKEGRKWVKINLFKEKEVMKPYPFDSFPGQSGMKISAAKVRTFKLGELTWPEAEAYLQRVDIAILPVGAIEQHGHHLPLDTDAYDAEYLAQQIAKACSHPKPLVLPLVSYGVSYHHDDFKGTISINNNTLSQLIYEIGMSAAKNGIKKLIILNGHGGNAPSLNFAAQMINRDARIFVGVDSGESSDVDIYQMVETPNDVHAGEFETSTALATRPHLVKLDQMHVSVPSFSSRYLDFTSKRGISWYAYTKRLSASGVMGDPSKATAEKGRKMWKIMIAHMVALVEDLKELSLEEIHQRRY
jgi:creatinine amidohydrolase/Fe(II)-dependent formamide hydrolase-like protein/7-cyano-7-deazaguanine synthase in queuosine biosynthesis